MNKQIPYISYVCTLRQSKDLLTLLFSLGFIWGGTQDQYFVANYYRGEPHIIHIYSDKTLYHCPKKDRDSYTKMCPKNEDEIRTDLVTLCPT